MSWKLVQLVHESLLPRRQKSVASALATFGTDDGDRIYPGVPRLARMTSYSERSVRAALRDLRAGGILKVQAPHGPHRPTRYRLNLEALPRTPKQLGLFAQDK